MSCVATLASCAHARPRTTQAPPPALPEQRRAARPMPLPEWFWEPVDAEVRGGSKVVELPVPEGSLVRVEGATRLWDELGAEGRERLRRDGLVVIPHRAVLRQMGAYYMDLREQRIPYLVTLDALSFAVHVAFQRALAEIDEQVLTPSLELLLAKLEARLSAEQRGAGVELGEALRIARAMVAVARGLSESATHPAADVAAAASPEVTAEIALVKSHAGRAQSPVLGTSIDYARLEAPRDAARPGSYRALAWLASAPLAFVAKSESPGAPVGVAAARLQTRAAMLLARVIEREVDPQIHAAWSRMARVSSFVWGPPDDVSPPELSQIAASMGITLEDPKNIANVVKVDRLRRRLAAGRPPQIFDGSGAAGRAGIALRIFGGHATNDARALTSLVGAQVRGRGLPSLLDIAAWVEAPEGRAALHESGADAFAGFDDALARSIAARPAEDAASRHASIEGSLFDVLMTWLTPRAETRSVTSIAIQRAAIESALAAWTFARHEGEPLARARPTLTPRPSRELAVTGAALPAFVEDAPDVIARLAATMGQMKRGLAAVGGLAATSPAMTSVAEVEDILRIALRVATREANDAALTAEDLAALAALPARLDRLEQAGAEEGAAATTVPRVTMRAEIFTDPSSDRVLSSATGALEQAIAIVREPGTGRLLVAVGAHVPHYEIVTIRASRLLATPQTVPGTGAAAAPAGSAIPDGGPEVRGVYTASFRMVR